MDARRLLECNEMLIPVNVCTPFALMMGQLNYITLHGVNNIPTSTFS